jgi:hypothetical protein
MLPSKSNKETETQEKKVGGALHPSDLSRKCSWNLWKVSKLDIIITVKKEAQGHKSQCMKLKGPSFLPSFLPSFHP